MNTPIRGADPRYQANLLSVFQGFPAWYVGCARISEIVVSTDPGVREQIAMYRHGTRDILVAPGIGTLLQRACAHELAHGLDDWSEENGNPHLFSNTPEWGGIHRAQTHFDLPKYRDDTREHFADMVAKALLMGLQKLSLSCPREAQYIGTVVFPALQLHFGAMQQESSQ